MMSVRGVQLRCGVDLDIKAATLGRVPSWDTGNRQRKFGCEMVVILSVAIQGSWRRTRSAVAVADSRHDCIAFVDLAQLC
jgi:hypothetical protein